MVAGKKFRPYFNWAIGLFSSWGVLRLESQMMDNAGERDLVHQAAGGDRAAFTELVQRYQNRIFGFVLRMTGSRDMALDLTQDTFLAAWQNVAGFRQESEFSTWLFQIAVNKTKNEQKRAGKIIPLPDDFDPASEAERPDVAYARKKTEKRLLETVAFLPDRQGTVFNLRYFEHMKFETIAAVLEISPSSVKTSYAEAVKKLKARLVRSELP